MKIEYGFAILLIVIGVFYGWASIIVNEMHGSEFFCKDQGYLLQTDTGGRYLEYRDEDYGRVKCFTCYADGCDREEFNVTKDWRGKLHKVGGIE